jgi:tRNA-binding EMAP/Myf-like protein
MISFEDFKKVEMTVGKILSAEKIPDTDKLLKLSVDLGLKKFSKENLPSEQLNDLSVLGEDRDIRQIISGISSYFPDPNVLVGKKCMFVSNLEPRMIRGFESNGMIVALSTDDNKFSLLEPDDSIPEGTKAR